MKSKLKTILVAVGMLSATHGLADESTDTIRDLTIENASAEIMANGDIRLRFTLSNDSPEAITVIGVSARSAGSGKIVGNSTHGRAFPVPGLILQPDEEIDFSTSHLQARLVGIVDRPESLAFQVLLDDGAVDGEAHVHQ